MESEAVQNVDPGSFKPFEVSATHLIYVGLGFFIVIFGMLSLFIKEKLYLGEAPIAAVFGIIVGPAALNLFNPSDWGNNHTKAPGGHITNEITLEIMRVTIALSVFAVGVELPKKYLLRHWRSLVMLLGPVMLWGWLITAAFIRALVPGLDFLNCLVIAACVTPTDPILAQAVVGGPWAEKHVPAHLRHMLQCESGCNDGAAFPFLYLALFLTVHRGDTRTAIAEWFYDALAYQIIFGTILGALIGWAARKAMRFSERKRWVDRESFVASYVSLAVASMGVNVLLGSDDLLAAFACGTAFAWDGWFTRQTEDSNFSNIVDLLFNCATFIYIGALMPWYEMAHAAGSLNIWRCFVLAICVLLTKRIPIILALWRWIPDIKTFREAMFSGHFGPIGVGAIFIATLGRSELPDEVPDPPVHTNDVLALTIQPIVFFFVLCSITVHGLTIPFFAFSKHATTITRTWSRNPSFGDGEPGWMNRIRRFNTGDTVRSEKEVEGGGMSEIRRVLNAQLGVIGKGAIGGDAEKELRREDSSPGDWQDGGDSSSGSRTRVGLMNTRTERDLELAEGDLGDEDEYSGDDGEDQQQSGGKRRQRRDIDDLEDWHPDEAEDPSCEWGGDDTAEAKAYRAKCAARRAARDTRRQRDLAEKEADGDLGEAPMDREAIWGKVNRDEEDEDVQEAEDDYGCSNPQDAREKRALQKEWQSEHGYPKARSWLEGDKLVIEYLHSRNAEPDVHVIRVSEDEAHRIQESDSGEEFSAAHSWLNSHKEEFDEHLDDGVHHKWGPGEAARQLIQTGALQRWYKQHGPKHGAGARAQTSNKPEEEKEETQQERNDRADMLYAAMTHHPNEATEAEEPPRRADEETMPPLAESKDAHGSDQDEVAPPRNSTSSQRPHIVARGTRRASMRKKILMGRLGFGGSSNRSTRAASGPEGEGSDEEEDAMSSDEEADADPRFPRSVSVGGLSTSSMSSDQMGSHRPSGLLRTPSDLERQRNTSTSQRATLASVSFLNTKDTNHDRSARGNTLQSTAGTTAASASSPLESPTEAPSSGRSMYRTKSLEPPSSSDDFSRSKKSRPSKRFSAFINSLTPSASPARSTSPAVSRRPSTAPDDAGNVERVTLQDEGEPEQPGSGTATPGPRVRTFAPEHSNGSSVRGDQTPREGILDPPGSAGGSQPRLPDQSGDEAAAGTGTGTGTTIAFRLPTEHS